MRHKLLIAFCCSIALGCGPDLTQTQAAEVAEREVTAYSRREGIDRRLLGAAKVTEYPKFWSFEYSSARPSHEIMVIVSRNGKVDLTRK